MEKWLWRHRFLIVLGLVTISTVLLVLSLGATSDTPDWWKFIVSIALVSNLGVLAWLFFSESRR